MEKSPSPSTTKPNDLSRHAKLMDALSKPTTHHSRMLYVVTTPNVPSVVNMLNAMHRMKLCGMPHFPQVKPCKSSKPLRKLNANAGMFLKMGLLQEEHSSSMPQTLTSITNSQRTNTTSSNPSNMGMTSSPNQLDGSEPPKTKPSSNSKVASGKPPLLTSLKRSRHYPTTCIPPNVPTNRTCRSKTTMQQTKRTGVHHNHQKS